MNIWLEQALVFLISVAATYVVMSCMFIQKDLFEIKGELRKLRKDLGK